MQAENYDKPPVKAEVVPAKKPPISPLAIAAGAGAGYVGTLLASVAVLFVFWIIIKVAYVLKIEFIFRLAALMVKYPISIFLIIAFYVIGAAAWGGSFAGKLAPSLKFVHGLLAGVGIIILHVILSPVLIKVLAEIFSFQVSQDMYRVDPDPWTVILWILIVLFAGIGAAGSDDD